MTQAPIALTCGEPAGVGPQLAVAAWETLKGELGFFLIGDPAHLPSGAPVVVIDDPAQAGAKMAQGLPVLVHHFPAPARPGTPDPANAQTVIEVIKRGVHLVQGGAASALTTGPIHKKSLLDGAGFVFPGHTEFLADLADIDRVVMMLVAPDLRVVPVTIHIALAEVPAALTARLICDTVRIATAALSRDFSVTAPRLAVAGLNPHAGEGGAMGREDIEVIAPALDQLRAEGLNIIGPLSADTMFHDRARAGYDAAFAMYHDQALIPIKTLAFDEGVNVTLGLPFVRTSPDHGTALDIAGLGRANPASLIAALRLARDTASSRARRG